jgi:hypothetical protein
MGGSHSRKTSGVKDSVRHDGRDGQIAQRLEAKADTHAMKRPLVIHEDGIGALAFLHGSSTSVLASGSDGVRFALRLYVNSSSLH